MIPKIVDGLELLKHHEGYNDTIYTDSLGYPTGGYGTLVSVGTRLPKAVWDTALKLAYEEAEMDIDSKFRYPTLLDPVRRVVLVDMRYNLGPEPWDGDGYKDWPIFIRQVKEGKYQQAAQNMRSTLWYTQVGTRGERLARMMETGEWPTK